MKHEWPLLGRGAQPEEPGNEHAPFPPAAPIRASVGVDGRGDKDQPLLPLALDEHVERIKACAALDAFARKRAVQIVTHGHTPEQDLARPLGLLACEAKDRLNAFTEIVGGRFGAMNLPPDHRERCLRYVEIAAGLLIALWDRCQQEVPEQ